MRSVTAAACNAGQWSSKHLTGRSRNSVPINAALSGGQHIRRCAGPKRHTPTYVPDADGHLNQSAGSVNIARQNAISGLGTRKRDGFNEMVADALAGKIDLIVTKSVSRFARNTVDSLVTIRKLKEKGVEVYFEKENIYSMDGKGELLLTIMSSLAQEESRSISENVTWGQRKRFSDGKVSLPYKQFLGYEKGPNKGDPPVVNPEQAKIVQRIYTRFMQGQTACGIAKELMADGIPTPAGKINWQKSTIESILSNEKYRGSALLQKEFTTDFLTKKRKVNEGEIPQYYIEHSHEAIIEPEEWDAVQEELRRRKTIGKAYSGKSVLASKVVCADCGHWYGAKTWHSKDKYKTVVWQCNQKYTEGKPVCKTPHVTEEAVKERRDELLTEFDNYLWLTVIDRVTVQQDGSLTFLFYNGSEISG